ncbi:MAG TPA: fructosamine kinase family protein, partial [Gillisia sp.]|nr:fructosamine kinase family protein [Gillisia sp.]
ELAGTGVIRIPMVLETGEVGDKSYILMEFIESGQPGKDFSKRFGQQLAALHRTTAKDFGYKIDNYIGSLPQYNAPNSTAAEFYISQRLEPQFKMARERGYNLGDISFLYKKCEELIPKEPPALVHGDLWGGNYIVDQNGDPCLIDPAVAFAPREMDLGMMKLFGGFDRKIFTSYHENFPLERGFEERVPLWQLYYLLVHLNIFGSGYKSQVAAILKQYS